MAKKSQATATPAGGDAGAANEPAAYAFDTVAAVAAINQPQSEPSCGEGLSAAEVAASIAHSNRHASKDKANKGKP